MAKPIASGEAQCTFDDLSPLFELLDKVQKGCTVRIITKAQLEKAIQIALTHPSQGGQIKLHGGVCNSGSDKVGTTRAELYWWDNKIYMKVERVLGKVHGGKIRILTGQLSREYARTLLT